MNQRERFLIFAVGALVLLIGGYYAFDKTSAAMKLRARQITTLKEGIRDRGRQLVKARKAQRRLSVYEEMALPANREMAASQYQSLLLSRLEEAGMVNVKVIPQNSSNDRNLIFKQLTFSVTCQGNLEQLVGLLHRFYSRDYLQRIRTLQIQPISASKNLNLSFTVDGLSMPRAANEKQLANRVSNRLEHGELPEYLKVIAERNLFSPANRSPKLASVGSQTAYPNRPFSVAFKASDPDSNDKIRYKLGDGTVLPDAKLDPETGILQWSPKEKGNFEVSVIASDNGIPSRSDTQLVTISVTDPPPDPPKPAPKLEFDHAKYTKLTAVVEEQNERKPDAAPRLQAWLFVQPTGESVQLYLGDSFTIGSVTAKVTAITDRSLTIETADKSRTIGLGQTLLEGTERPIEARVASGPIPEAPPSAPVAPPQ